MARKIAVAYQHHGMRGRGCLLLPKDLFKDKNHDEYSLGGSITWGLNYLKQRKWMVKRSKGRRRNHFTEAAPSPRALLSAASITCSPVQDIACTSCMTWHSSLSAAAVQPALSFCRAVLGGLVTQRWLHALRPSQSCNQVSTWITQETM